MENTEKLLSDFVEKFDFSPDVYVVVKYTYGNNSGSVDASFASYEHDATNFYGLETTYDAHKLELDDNDYEKLQEIIDSCNSEAEAKEAWESYIGSMTMAEYYLSPSQIEKIKETYKNNKEYQTESGDSQNADIEEYFPFVL